jgi:outer membrane receptor protein involved in Fe transport
MSLRTIALLLVAVAAAAQTGNEGSIEGLVVDPTDAVVASAAVTARDVNTAAVFRAATDARGFFHLLVLPTGTYEITVTSGNFATTIEKNIAVTVGARLNLTIRLQVAARADAIVVSAEAPLLETTRSAISSNVDARSISELPLLGRNILNFVLLAPGVNNGNGAAFFSAGGIASMSSLVIDGADNNGFGPEPTGTTATNRYLFSQDSIQEFQVLTSSYSAEFGRAGTSMVNVVTKSGTNSFHGDAFWYYRDRGLDAIGYINKVNGLPKDTRHGQQAGASAGGPVLRDQLFFFGSYDRQLRRELNPTVLTLPVNFQVSADPNVGPYQQRALDYLRPRAAPYNRYFDQNVALAKLDWHASSRHLASARWNRHRLSAPNLARVGPVESLEHTGTIGQVVDSSSISLTSQLKRQTVNVARFSFVRSGSPMLANSNLPEADIFENGQRVIFVGRAPNLPVDNSVRRGEWSDTVAITRGRHELRTGVNALLELGRFFSTINFAGTYRFNSLASFGHNLAGAPAPAANDRYVQAFAASGASSIDVHPDYTEFAGFVQDHWRVHPRVTIDAGVRYDVQLMRPATVRNPSAVLAAAGIDTAFIPRDGNNFAPRLGLAWSPLRNQRLVVRGGYGMFFPRLLAATAARSFAQNGITSQIRTFNAAAIPLYPRTFCGPTWPASCVPSSVDPTIIMAFARDYRQSVVQQGSFGVEYRLGERLTLSATYLWTHGTYLYHWTDVNLTPDVPRTALVAGVPYTYRTYRTQRPLTGFDRVLLLTSDGNSNYHALALEAKKRWAHHFQLLAAYTFSKALDDNPTLGNLNPGSGDGALQSDPGNRRADRGPSNTDLRHRLVVNGVWKLDYARRLARPLRAALADWQISGIANAQSGFAYSGVLNSDLNNDGNQLTDRAPGVARNSFYLPANVSLDSRLTRSVRLHEQAGLQFSWDVFNLTNRVNTDSVRTGEFSRQTTCPSATACLVPNPSFGTITNTALPRTMQLSVRLTW